MTFDGNKEILHPNGEALREGDTVARDASGKAIIGADGKPETIKGKPLTLGAIAVGMLLEPETEEDPRSGQKVLKALPVDQQTKRFALAVKISNAMAAGLPAHIADFESVLLKELVAKRGMPLITGRFVEELDGAGEPSLPPPPAELNGAATTAH